MGRWEISRIAVFDGFQPVFVSVVEVLGAMTEGSIRSDENEIRESIVRA